MPDQEDDPLSKKTNFDGLSYEIHEVLRDKEFQGIVNKFVKKDDTHFKILKGLGFTIALASGLFGYFLKANSEADDRKAEMIHKVIDEKENWVRKVDLAILDLRKTRFLLKHDCDSKKSLSLNEKKREF